MTVRTFNGVPELLAAAGQDIGATEWRTIDQPQVDLFAEATDDRQWIHVDQERAAQGPFGRTIAHGLLTLSLLPSFMRELYRVEGVTMGINYGYDRVRFVSPVPVGSRLRATAVLRDTKEVPGGAQVRLEVTVEVEGQDKPACVVESILRYMS